MSAKVLAGYVPVLHKGYLDFFNKFKDVDSFYLFGDDVIKLSDYLRKDLRAFDQKSGLKILNSLGRFKKVYVLNKDSVKDLQKSGKEIILADDDISHLVADKYFSSNKVSYYPVFLRWDRRSLERVAPEELHGDIEISSGKFETEIIKEALKEASKSSDIWRRVGGVLIVNNKKTTAHNSSMPTPYTAWVDGDPRTTAKQGLDTNIALYIHAEAQLIARAAKAGQRLEGSTIYVTTFPCPACAMLVANSGIKTLYYKDGYGVLDSKRLLEENGVKLVHVITDDLPDKPGEYVKYVKS